MSLITERLPVIWEIDQVTARGSLATLHQLSQNALEEMRSLLLELHPLSLTNAKLGDLITQVSNIMTSRTGIAIQVQIIAQVVVPPAVHFTIYRVVQEALNNVALHALANHVDVTLNSTAQQLELTIQDNGRGFDPNHTSLGRLGLIIMKERVDNIGGVMEIISHEGQGTLIKVVWVVAADEGQSS
jgi:NarL family two-component system sensor histidine kinase LiaS